MTAGDHRFREMILASKTQAERFGYRFAPYDLGGLGFGEPWAVGDDHFASPGGREALVRLENGAGHRRLGFVSQPNPAVDCDRGNVGER